MGGAGQSPRDRRETPREPREARPGASPGGRCTSSVRTSRGSRTPDPRPQVDRLVGPRPSGEDQGDEIGVDHPRVDRLGSACGVSGAEGLRALVEERYGPITDRRAARLASERSREAFWSWLAEEASRLPLAGDEPSAVEPWVAPYGAQYSGGRPRRPPQAARPRPHRAPGPARRRRGPGVPGRRPAGRRPRPRPGEHDRGIRPRRRGHHPGAAAGDGRGGGPAAVGGDLRGARPTLLDGARPRAGLGDDGEAVVLTLAQLRRRPFPPLAGLQLRAAVDRGHHPAPTARPRRRDSRPARRLRRGRPQHHQLARRSGGYDSVAHGRGRLPGSRCRSP